MSYAAEFWIEQIACLPEKFLSWSDSYGDAMDTLCHQHDYLMGVEDVLDFTYGISFIPDWLAAKTKLESECLDLAVPVEELDPSIWRNQPYPCKERDRMWLK
jgi:hypothetical protein